ncbi:MAG TPA: YceI family protein [Acidimicrobiales bacterium]|nr:YceI family protein [Acidimicrobiales bacterium]
MSKTIKIVIGIVVGLAVVISAGTYVYLNFIQEDAPPPLSLDSTPSTTGATQSAGATPTDEIGGTWRPTAQSIFGYRVKEVLFGQSKEAAGRTSKVTGTLVIDGDKVTTTDLSVDMASVTSDENRRDGQFRGRIMDVATYPTATFKLTQPIQIGDTSTGMVSAKATGDLTLRGTTKSVTFDLKAQREGAQFKVNGTIPIKFDEWKIPNPSNAAASTEDNGVLEFLVVFEKEA